MLWNQGIARVVGIDEAGIGSLCGAVFAAACLLPVGCLIIPAVRDSKLLSAEQRDRLYPKIRAQAIAITVGAASVAEIELLNIRRASHLAMRRALARIGRWDYALIDGSPIRGSSLLPAAEMASRVTTIVDGDATSYSIACASIVAKVTRDRLLRALAVRHPGYDWEHNAGYGSPKHLAALRDLGITPLHRRAYAPIHRLLEPPSLVKPGAMPPGADSPGLADGSSSAPPNGLDDFLNRPDN